jgi:hypothetical protein
MAVDGAEVKLGDCLHTGQSDAAIVTAALERQILRSVANGFDPSDSQSVFIPLTTATIPIRVESGPNDDWSCRFVFDLPQVHDDGTIEYRVRC